MPCYERRTIVQEFGEHTDLDVLESALQALGYQTSQQDGYLLFGRSRYFDSSFAGGSFTVQRALDMPTVRKAYTAAAVKAAASRFGWKVAEQGPGKLTLRRRR